MTSNVWYPFTQHAERPHLPVAVSAEGAYITTADGRRVLDAISSWWVITHGHRHPAIVAAIKAQIDSLDQVIFAEFTHESAENLAHRLVALASPGLNHVFFSDSGSICVEVGIKMALGFWRHRGEPRHRIVVLEHGYHGDTVGAMSVGARGAFTAPYDRLLFDVSFIPFPWPGREEATFAALEALAQAGDVAAFLVEPRVLGAGGMLMYPATVLVRLREICAAHGVLFIADEVMTGWGRTGARFACEGAGVAPDIACYSKGLTGGTLPLAVTLCTEEIFAAHYSEDPLKTFFHSSSFTANPIACAAALANLEIWEREPVLARIGALQTLQGKQLDRFRDDPRLRNLRQTGTITAMDVIARDPGYFSSLGPRLKQVFRDGAVLLRPLGNTLYVMPPYCVTEGDLELVYDTIQRAVDAVA